MTDTNSTNNFDNNTISTNKPHKLTIATQNVQSISNLIKQNQLIQHIKLNTIDIMGISETNLKKQEAIHFHLHNSADYTYFFSSSKDHHIGSGVGLIIKKDISMHIFNTGSIDGRTVFVDIHSKGKQVLRIIQIYLHSNKKHIIE